MNYSVEITSKVMELIGNDQKVAEDLKMFCCTHKAGETGNKVDAFDGFSVFGHALSYLRDNENKTAIVMTLEEARALDSFVAISGRKYSRKAGRGRV